MQEQALYYVYLLMSIKSGKLYYGYTNNLKRRVAEHQADGYWQLLYYEAYHAEQDARIREWRLKHYGQARAHLKKRLQRTLEGAN